MASLFKRFKQAGLIGKILYGLGCFCVLVVGLVSLVGIIIYLDMKLITFRVSRRGCRFEEVQGTVLDARTGKPLPGAFVIYSRLVSLGKPKPFFYLGDGGGPKQVHRGAVQTDARGRYSVPESVISAPGKFCLPYGSRIFVYRPGYALAVEEAQEGLTPLITRYEDVHGPWELTTQLTPYEAPHGPWEQKQELEDLLCPESPLDCRALGEECEELQGYNSRYQWDEAGLCAELNEALTGTLAEIRDQATRRPETPP